MRVVTRLQITLAILGSTFTPMCVTRPRAWDLAQCCAPALWGRVAVEGFQRRKKNPKP